MDSVFGYYVVFIDNIAAEAPLRWNCISFPKIINYFFMI